jgi:Mg2+-importing ATPase
MSELTSKKQVDEIRQLAESELVLLYEKLNSSPAGLTTDQLELNRQVYGANVLPVDSIDHPLLRLLKLFISPLSLLLISLSIASYLTGEKKGAVVIASMVFLSTLLTFFQEHKSNKAAQKLKNMVSAHVRVVRDGQELEVNLSDIVPGDLIQLSAGDLIPADIRIIQSKDLFINQSSLTGESLPAEKTHTLAKHDSTSVFDWTNICFMGSHVVSGAATALVLKTANYTFFGELAREITLQTKSTSFDEGIRKFSWLMIRLMFVMIPLVFFVNGLMKGDWFEAALFAIAIGVGLAPEMLPMLVTINLAKGAIVMAKKRVIIKRLNSIQNLGAMDVLCTDKTGTLTEDRIVLERHVDVNGMPNERVLEFAYLNSHYQAGLKNLLDIAVLKHVEVHRRLHDEDIYQKIDEIPFDFQRRRMSVVIRKNNQEDILICKGAVEEIFSCCKYAQVGEELILLDESHLDKLNTVVADLNNDGFRVIAVAMAQESMSPKAYSVADESELILLGYIAFLDPPKESAGPAIKALHEYGVNVKILTGDNELITRKICHDVGLPISQVILGAQVELMNDERLAIVVESANIFAKMTPAQKARVIKALKAHGHVVGYMGDGINDGPSLRVADVSISVDSAVDIAKESADIILLEKSLMVLQQGVVEGRRVFGNIMKYIKMSASSNFGNTFSMIGASAFLPFLPMAPVQILLNNLLYDFSQTAVPTDDVDSEYLKNPRPWHVGHLMKYILFIGPISSIFDYVTFAFLWFVLKANTLASMPLFQTGWFVESLLSQTLVVHIIRTGKIPFLESSPSKPLLVTTLGICFVGVVLPYTVIGSHFQMEALPGAYWYGLAIIMPTYLLLTHIIKSIVIKKIGFI